MPHPQESRPPSINDVLEMQLLSLDPESPKQIKSLPRSIAECTFSDCFKKRCKDYEFWGALGTRLDLAVKIDPPRPLLLGGSRNA